MKPFLLKRYTLAVIVVVLLGVGAYLLRDQWDSGAADEIVAEATGPTAAEPESPAAEESPAAAESIAFPHEMWEAAGLRVEPVGKGEMNEQIELTGKIALNEDRLAHVFPLVEGRVDEVHVRFGQRVKNGELLVVVQSKEVALARCSRTSGESPCRASWTNFCTARSGGLWCSQSSRTDQARMCSFWWPS